MNVKELNPEISTKTKKPLPGLGKGLGALIPSIQFSKEKGFKINPENEETITDGSTALIDIDKVKQNPYQPRHEFDETALQDLANSIKEHGVIQPITVRHSINGYELISGERRLRASMKAGLKKIPAYIMDVIKTDRQMLEVALIENIQRENLNPIETANGYRRLMEECNYTQEQVSERMGKDRATVANFLRLLRLPEIIQEQLRSKKLTMGHARALLGLSDQAKMIAAWKETTENELSVRATEALVRDIESGKVRFNEEKKLSQKKEKKDVVTPDAAFALEEAEDKLRHIYGTNVKIFPRNATSGTVEFEFYSIDDFERLVELLETVKTIS